VCGVGIGASYRALCQTDDVEIPPAAFGSVAVLVVGTGATLPLASSYPPMARHRWAKSNMIAGLRIDRCSGASLAVISTLAELLRYGRYRLVGKRLTRSALVLVSHGTPASGQTQYDLAGFLANGVVRQSLTLIGTLSVVLRCARDVVVSAGQNDVPSSVRRLASRHVASPSPRARARRSSSAIIN
jgi:hypothetical protein